MRLSRIGPSRPAKSGVCALDGALRSSSPVAQERPALMRALRLRFPLMSGLGRSVCSNQSLPVHGSGALLESPRSPPARCAFLAQSGQQCHEPASRDRDLAVSSAASPRWLSHEAFHSVTPSPHTLVELLGSGKPFFWAGSWQRFPGAFRFSCGDLFFLMLTPLTGKDPHLVAEAKRARAFNAAASFLEWDHRRCRTHPAMTNLR